MKAERLRRQLSNTTDYETARRLLYEIKMAEQEEEPKPDTTAAKPLPPWRKPAPEPQPFDPSRDDFDRDAHYARTSRRTRPHTLDSPWS